MQEHDAVLPHVQIESPAEVVNVAHSSRAWSRTHRVPKNQPSTPPNTKNAPVTLSGSPFCYDIYTPGASPADGGSPSTPASSVLYPMRLFLSIPENMTPREAAMAEGGLHLTPRGQLWGRETTVSTRACGDHEEYVKSLQRSGSAYAQMNANTRNKLRMEFRFFVTANEVFSSATSLTDFKEKLATKSRIRWTPRQEARAENFYYARVIKGAPSKSEDLSMKTLILELGCRFSNLFNRQRAQTKAAMESIFNLPVRAALLPFRLAKKVVLVAVR
eukprot:GEMP01023933.1.p1 GENE.GEMP01023933.1~~GEMP01023933.1.p1  ORF type:complete len:274 (-),score=62.39 GEMP01023933.1:1465-2286(-)